MFTLGCNKNNCELYDGWHEEAVVLRIHNNFPTEYLPTLKASADVWNNAASRTVFVIGDKYHQELTPDRVHTLSFPTVWFDTWNTQARAYLRMAGAKIIDADVMFNRNYSFSLAGEPAQRTKISLQSLMIHELGHVLGMQHEAGTVMNETLSWGEDRITLTQRDVDRLRCHY